jgi:WD40 repeat protein
MDTLQVVLQFLDEEGYRDAFEALQRESETTYKPYFLREHVLRQTLGEYALSEQTAALRALSVGRTFSTAFPLTKVVYPAAPVSLFALPDSIIVGFADQSISKLNLSNELTSTIRPSIGTALCFVASAGTVFCGSMGGTIAAFNSDFEIRQTVEIDNGWINSLAFSENQLWAGTRNGFLAVIDPSSLSILHRFPHSNSLTALCSIGPGVIYAVQNDPAFHFRTAKNPERELLVSMLPNEFDVGCLAIRDLAQSPADATVFAALTDQGRANVYRWVDQKVELLRTITHFVSDGLTQPQLLWAHGGVVIVTSSDWKIVAVEIAGDRVVLEIDGWKKAPRCLALAERDGADVLIVGAFDKTISTFELREKTE